MDVKGGIAYVDFKGLDIVQTGSNVIEGVFKNIKKAYNSRKLIVAHNVNAGLANLNDIIPFAVRMQNVNTYVLALYISNSNSAGTSARYVSVSSTDTVTVVSY